MEETTVPPETAPKISKRAAEKAAKKAAKKEKQLEIREKAPSGTAAPKKAEDEAPNGDMFTQGWLKSVYEEKPVGDGNVRTRFPPEPNGFLHIGHAKAITVNFGFAKAHNGICFLRYDDTNPAKEEEIYFTAIQDMVKWLGFEPYQITYSSDHFDKLYELAEELIKKDKAYVCHCSRDEINMQRGGPDNRGKRYACDHRSRSTEDSLEDFRAMRDGKYKPGEAFLRMKQKLTDETEGNPQMWDLPAYRVTETTYHHRTGDKWRIYPTYDFTHCLCDSFEEITHSLCTNEFYLSRTSYDWLLEVLEYKEPGSDKKGPMQREYGRLNVAGTILSKRRIQMLVEGAKVKDAEGNVVETIPPQVRGWDDPRLYTLVALRRRGVPPGALLAFVHELGVTDALTNIQIYRLEATVRKYLERTVPRLSLILEPIRIIIDNLPEDHLDEITIPFDPKNPNGDSRTVPFTRTVYIDRSDFREEDDPNFFRLAPGKTVGLLNVPNPIKAISFSKDESGKVNEIHAEYLNKEAPKPKAYIHWVSDAPGNKPEMAPIKTEARVFNALFRTSEPNGLDWSNKAASKEGTPWHKDINPNSEIIYGDALLECGFWKAIEKAPFPHDGVDGKDSGNHTIRFQALRTGYFCVDKDTDLSTENAGKTSLNRIVSLREDAGK